MDYGIKVARKGKDINSTNPRDFSLHTGINNLKVYMSEHSTISVVTNNGESDPFNLARPVTVTTRDIEHNLGYKPQAILYAKHPFNNQWYRARGIYPNTGEVGSWELGIGVRNIDNNTTQLRFYDGFPEMPSSPTNIEYKYFIFADPREDVWFEPAITDTDNAEETGYGFKIARPGIDVKTAEPKNLSYSSEFETPLIAKIIDCSESGEYEHGLGYPPMFLSYFNYDLMFLGLNGYQHDGEIKPYVLGIDENKVYVDNPIPVPLYVIIFANPLDE